MLYNNECSCKRVLVYPRINNPATAIVMVQVPTGNSPNLDNYYTKSQVDELLSQKISPSELNSPTYKVSSEDITTMFNNNNF